MWKNRLIMLNVETNGGNGLCHFKDLTIALPFIFSSKGAREIHITTDKSEQEK